MRALPLLAMTLALASCVGAPAPPPPPPPAPRPVPIPTPTPTPTLLAADWRDWPLTPGNWVYRQDARGSIALFGQPGLDATLTLRCDRQAAMVYLSRQGAAAGIVPMTIRTTSALRTLSATPSGGATPYLVVTLTPRDSLLDAMGFSRGRFVVQQPGYPTLVVPAWAEILRVTEDCRR
jgi:hypothetical protein